MSAGVQKSTRVLVDLRITHQRHIINGSDHLWSVDCRLPKRLHHYLARGVGMSSKAHTYLLGLVAIFAGLATMVVSSSRLIDIFGLVALIGGLGATAWASGGMSFLKNYSEH
jgi:hypothetical protein